ncbi:hypothetical protein ACO0K9_00245 [Undibacterium sp. Ji50W]|uniref:hypothetical protein n=1 Tax=Undibacterium sp. Ji50W TaxID=3413041 RepID=UPI003BEFB36A
MFDPPADTKAEPQADPASDLPSLKHALFQQPDVNRLHAANPASHAPRFLLLMAL